MAIAESPADGGGIRPPSVYRRFNDKTACHSECEE